MIGSQFISLDDFNKIFEVEKMKIELQASCVLPEHDEDYIRFESESDSGYINIYCRCNERTNHIKINIDDLVVITDVCKTLQDSKRIANHLVNEYTIEKSKHIDKLIAEIKPTREYADHIANQFKEQNKC